MRRSFRYGRLLRRTLAVVGLALGCVLLLLGAGLVGLAVADTGVPSPAVHGTGHDAEWLGHAWVDGRKNRSDVDALAAQLHGTGIHDLFVHSGPFRNDGSLGPGTAAPRPMVDRCPARRAARVRVQAWLGAHPVPGQLDLGSAATRAHLLGAVDQVLDDGFDGVHYDFEPVRDGDHDLVTVLHLTHELTQRRHTVLSLSATGTEHLPGMAAVVRRLPWRVDPALLVAPALFVHGGADRVVPAAHGEWLARRCRGALLWRHQDEGHISILNSGEAALNWLHDNAR